MSGPPLHRELPDRTPCVASVRYGRRVKGLVMASKEGRRTGVGDTLAAALTRAVAEVGWGPARHAPRLLLVPPASAWRVRLRRAGDPVARLAHVAATRLRRAGGDVDAACLLRPLPRARTGDQTGRGAAARWEALAGAFAAAPAPVHARTGADRAPVVQVVVVDDVVTTGATAVEAVRALRAAGWDVLGVAAVASR